jgi:hypothetical protein
MDIFKTCSKCHVKKISSYFCKDIKSKDGFLSNCRECQAKVKIEFHKRNKAREIIDIPNVKLCPGCNIEKPSIGFNKAKRNKDGLADCCKDCGSYRNKRCREENSAREVIIIPEFKRCNMCKITLSGSLFSKAKRNKSGLSDYCKKCNSVRHKKLSYGISLEQFNYMLDLQGTVCAICKTLPKNKGLQVDHDHLTANVRGLLCGTCNRSLGFFKDNPFLLNNAKRYLNAPLSKIKYRTKIGKAVKARILTEQNFMCKIYCVNLHNQKVCLDHCHKTGLVRGCLCERCNCGLGQLKDSVDLFKNAIDYLNRSNGYL